MRSTRKYLGTSSFGVRITACAFGVCMVLALVGCAGPAPSPKDTSDVETSIVEDTDAQTTDGGPSDTVDNPDEYSTDQMFNDHVTDARFYVFNIDGRTFTVDDLYDVYIDESLQDGKFYQVTADVTYLNGGVAGYVNFPQIEEVSDCKEVSPLEIGLPSIEDSHYGLTCIGDYADGDVFLYERNASALWKDGAWLYRYDDEIKLDDGTTVCCRAGVSQDSIRKGIVNGVLSCADYFVLPA